ncbi:LysR family transcriptional regulator [Ensifer sp. ENS04]|uniref:LysR substrate-binding domain-containing protein n=1 Tax=Ensifer sp. ENS04 TaxID=2769281 RepID=UPI001783951F|nr:LysR substrate-binding domain-containing protein [Ensifer sp. ENS04]MBD9538924.1 LysR family transcriptional regulator [Ensifer sp. ENS04]
MSNPLDLDLLKTFVAVAETGSFSSAAPRIGRSQSAVSMQMQRLEQSVGKQLLTRGSKAVVPNAVGTELLLHARKLLKMSDDALASVSRPEESGCVRLGIPDDYAAFLLPPVLARFAAEHPLVTVELVCEPSAALSQAVKDRRVDLAIITRLPDQSVEILRREPFVWVGSPLHVAWEQSPLPIALFEVGCAARMNAMKALADDGRPYRCTYSSASLLGLTAIVQAGLAIAALAMCSVPPTLRVLSRNEGLPELRDLEIGMLRSSDPRTGAVECLTGFLRRELTSEH